MYKVFFKDRTVYFGDDFSKTFERNTGLYYRYNNLQELSQLIRAFYMLDKIEKLFIFHHDIVSLFEEFKSCFRQIEAGGGVVRNGTGEFLVIRRDGIWDLPKGKLEPGESFETAALREVEEEVGLKGLYINQPILSTYHTYQLSSDLVLKKTKWYELQYDGNEDPVPEAKENITEAVWVKPGETGFIRSNTYQSVMDVLYLKDLL